MLSVNFCDHVTSGKPLKQLAVQVQEHKYDTRIGIWGTRTIFDPAFLPSTVLRSPSQWNRYFMWKIRQTRIAVHFEAGITLLETAMNFSTAHCNFSLLISWTSGITKIEIHSKPLILEENYWEKLTWNHRHSRFQAAVSYLVTFKRSEASKFQIHSAA